MMYVTDKDHLHQIPAGFTSDWKHLAKYIQQTIQIISTHNNNNDKCIFKLYF